MYRSGQQLERPALGAAAPADSLPLPERAAALPQLPGHLTFGLQVCTTPYECATAVSWHSIFLASAQAGQCKRAPGSAHKTCKLTLLAWLLQCRQQF